MENKKCTKCNTIRPATTEYFYKQKNGKFGLSSRCKSCRKKYHADWHKDNRESESNKRKEYYQANKQKIVKYNVEYSRNRRKTDTAFRIVYNTRRRIQQAIKNNSKASSSLNLIGCSFPELKSYLEKQFTNGMSWDNYGEWHIDHIRPCCSFDLSDPEQQKQCFHYSNLQPLWADENFQKGGSY
jgi:hypothetical protein